MRKAIKLLALILCLLMTLSVAFVGCGNTTDTGNGGSDGGSGQSGSADNGTENGGSGGGNNGGTNVVGDYSVLPGGKKPTAASQGLEYALTDDSQGYKVTGMGACTDKFIVIPATYEGKPVTEIGASAFKNEYDLMGVVFPNSLKIIGSDAFWAAGVLYAEIPEGVTEIGWRAFQYCNLVGVTIPSTVTSIGDSAFQYCYKLLDVCNKSSLTITVGDNGNGHIASNAKNVYSGNETKLSEKDGFIRYIDAKQNIYTIVGYCGNATELILPEKLDGMNYTIHRQAFKYQTAISKAVISDGVTYIGEGVFDNCFKLLEVTLGSGITMVDTWGLGSNTKLIEICNKSVVDAENIKSYCNVLNVYTPTSGSSKLVKDGDFVYYVDAKAGQYYLVDYRGSATAVQLPEKISGNNYEIYDHAFYRNNTLKTVTIPESVTKIGTYAFSSCENLEYVSIPDSVKTVKFYAFAGNENMKYIIVPKSDIDIEAYAFTGSNTNLYDIFYEGSKAEWDSNGFSDTVLYGTKAIYYYSETNVSGAWHYVEGKPVIW